MVSVAMTIIVLAVLGILGIVGYLIYLGSSSATSLPAFQNSGTQVPGPLSNMLSANATVATQRLAELSSNTIASDPQFSVSYNGTISVHPSGLLKVYSFTSPLYVTDDKYHGSVRFSANATGFPFAGDANITYLNNSDEGSLICANINVTALSESNYQSVLSKGQPIRCVAGDELLGLNMEQLAAFNLSTVEQQGIRFTYLEDYQSSYKGMPCTYLSGVLTGNKNGTGVFEMCVSDSYYLPLSLAFSLNNMLGSGTIIINETSISNSSEQSYVDSMPGQ